MLTASLNLVTVSKSIFSKTVYYNIIYRSLAILNLSKICICNLKKKLVKFKNKVGAC
jgi:hypothetical protein